MITYTCERCGDHHSDVFVVQDQELCDTCSVECLCGERIPAVKSIICDGVARCKECHDYYFNYERKNSIMYEGDVMGILSDQIGMMQTKLEESLKLAATPKTKDGILKAINRLSKFRGEIMSIKNIIKLQ